MSSSTRRLQNIARIQCLLDALYPHPPVPLNSVNTFTFLVAVVLSAQTTDGKVRPRIAKERTVSDSSYAAICVTGQRCNG